MVNMLATLYGEKINVQVLENAKEKQVFYDFPTIEQMSEGLDSMEKTLREKGFGYRAKYIAKTVETLSKIEGGYKNWESGLRKMGYSEAKAEIQKLDGVGPKVSQD